MDTTACPSCAANVLHAGWPAPGQVHLTLCHLIGKVAALAVSANKLLQSYASAFFPCCAANVMHAGWAAHGQVHITLCQSAAGGVPPAPHGAARSSRGGGFRQSSGCSGMSSAGTGLLVGAVRDHLLMVVQMSACNIPRLLTAAGRSDACQRQQAAFSLRVSSDSTARLLVRW